MVATLVPLKDKEFTLAEAAWEGLGIDSPLSGLYHTMKVEKTASKCLPHKGKPSSQGSSLDEKPPRVD